MAIQDEYTSTLPPANVEDENNVIIRGPLPLTTPTPMTFIVLRHTLASIMGRIVHHFQKMHSARHYVEVLTLDDELAKFIQSLPPFFALDPDTTLDATYPYIPAHRFLLVTEILFVRITLHRPYLLRRLSSDKYMRSRNVCFECAMKDYQIRRRSLNTSAIKDVRDPVTSAYREFQAAMISGIYLVLYPRGKDAETMHMVLDGFIEDHDRDQDNTTKRELKIIQFLKDKAQLIAKGSPKPEEAHVPLASSPSAMRDRPHNDAQLLLQLSSPRGYPLNTPQVTGPSFPNGSSSTSPATPQYATPPYGAPHPAVHNLQRSDSQSQSGAGSPSHEDETAAQTLLDQWCNVFTGAPTVEGMAGAQSMPWSASGLGDWSGFMATGPSPQNGPGTGGNHDADGLDWNYWESLINQIRSGPVA
jgi:hypothetical protein